MSTLNRRALLGAVAGTAGLTALGQGSTSARAQTASGGDLLAPTPPMGWNSWNSFATTITEKQAKDVARVMADKLLPYGYDVFTVDIQWYEPNATGYAYRDQAELAMDGYGRLQPAPNRFPSARGGAGFKPLADHIHGLGLKFGIHLMRGIPRIAYDKDLPVLGTEYTARDIANPLSICTWNGDMYGVDMSKPGAQAYYNSVFQMFADWGVDYVKVDDISRPYEDHWDEVEAIRSAMDATGRPMVLSLSPGETNIEWGAHAQKYAQLWRISDDFWDDWQLLHDQFERLHNWNGFRRPGAWPDADMLPLGTLALGDRKSRFTRDEQQTLMTLWAIARSPLIMGGDLRDLEDNTLRLLTNRDVIAVNQHSHNNMQLWNNGDQIVWRAESPEGDIYAALFNLHQWSRPIEQPLKALGAPDTARVTELWSGRTSTISDSISQELRSHASALYKISAV
ncbi:glycoside hydrolase family 27 protein [Parvularcula flava]|uniref:Alpha-galactosidase n=1 Tax=Aquisalinus luteolus TaxID=1566827 RepID=A0A8J3A1D9_9PROT|nr:glycoside hydrolase family 27 protein [Aquisalinus luteolus]NHK27396.1 glycoside hydrolase family 27 protein [Aquisalinus luteolus]GGH95312.1 alpha-galactosidase [Aquisalinus luteolus]